MQREWQLFLSIIKWIKTMIWRRKNLKIKGKSPILIKFHSKNIIDSLQAGNIYMNELNIFRKMEEGGDSHEVGDLMENKIFSKAYELSDGTPCNFIMTEENKSNYVYCLFYVTFNSNYFQFSDEQKEKLLCFGDTALVIQDVQEFLYRVTNQAEKEGYNIHHRKVMYYKENKEITKELMNYLAEGLYNFSFLKRDKYRYQQEYRLAINTEKLEEEHIILKIKDISDISFQINAKKILEDGIYVTI